MCTGSLTGPSGVRHSVEVTAESIYEAAALGVSALKSDGWADAIAPGTEREVQVREPATYFRKQNGVPERLLEMLSQARAISFDVTPSPLEAALFEPDEIKRHRPPYNVALTMHHRALWFASPDLSARSREPSPHCPLGPFASTETLDQFVALARGDRAALRSGPWGPDDDTFTAGCDRLWATHPELSRVDLSDCATLLRLGTRLWRGGRRDRDVDEDDANDTRRRVTVWTPEFVQASLEWLALRAALARRRAIWLTRLFDSSVVWREPGDSC